MCLMNLPRVSASLGPFVVLTVTLPFDLKYSKTSRSPSGRSTGAGAPVTLTVSVLPGLSMWTRPLTPRSKIAAVKAVQPALSQPIRWM